jgi:oxepin-CoA hydrolase / 3-oxo-5,6-dehydrosuberyl-CoA semialdehyde dehydrogenase
MIIPFEVNDPAVRDGFFRRHLWEAIAALRVDAPPRWGRMTARDMVEHLSWVFEVSTGQASVECAVPEARRERWKAFLYDDTPMPREFRNPALAGGLPPLRHPGLDDARITLRKEVDRFLDHCRDTPQATHVHPTFGPLGMEEWGRSHFKHAYHHLLQFDLVEGGPSSP